MKQQAQSLLLSEIKGHINCFNVIFIISKEELQVFYRKAEESCYKCLNNKDHKFLEEEMQMPVASVGLKHSSVKVVISQDDIAGYTLEIELSLWGNAAKSIGKYWYIEDDKGAVVDDGLVLY
jgi:hypothetical protein